MSASREVRGRTRGRAAARAVKFGDVYFANRVREAPTSEVGEQRLLRLALGHDVTLAVDVENRTGILALHRA